MAKRRANHEGTIFKRNNGSWRAQISLNGYRLSYTGKTQKECQTWVKETRNQIERGLTYKGADTFLGDFLKDWMVTVRSSRSKSTATLYRRTVVKQIIPFIGKVKLKDLRPDRIQQFYDFIHKNGKSEHAVHYVHKVLNIALNHAVKLGLMGLNPCAPTSPPRPKQKEMKFLDEIQVQVLLDTTKGSGDRFYPLYHLAINTGMRQAELLGLKWEDIGWERRTLQVKRQALHPEGGGYIFTEPKSKSGKRTIVLGKQTLEILRAHREWQWEQRRWAREQWIDLDLMFPSRKGTPVSGSILRRAFRKLLAESGLPRIRFHDLRHTATSLMLNYGIPVLIVSRRLGHSKPSITMDVYGHLIPSKQEEAADLMDEIMTPIDVSRCTKIAPD